MSHVNVTKTYLPPIDEFLAYVSEIWRTGQLTNQGPLVAEFEQQVSRYLGLEDSHLHFVANGTIGLQLALRSLGVTSGEVITTPFSYVATVSSILWERCTPVFVDIDAETLALKADAIEGAITDRTRAILPVHVFGNAADVTSISTVAEQHGLPVIYDGAHAFGSRLNGRTLLDYGDVAVTSFHATKAFHTIEGGAVITRDDATSDRIELLKRFGHNADDHVTVGINAKASEFAAAMGLANLPHLKAVTSLRRELVELYDSLLTDHVRRPALVDGLEWNYSYYPVLFAGESELLEVQRRLNAIDVAPRRYFYPALNTLPYLENTQRCDTAEDIARRVMCLPLYPGLDEGTVEKIARIVVDV